MLMTNAGRWHFMTMAQAFIVDTQQSGARGGDKFYSTNWAMLSAQHSAGRGSFMLQTMFSLEPATVTNRSYPLLFTYVIALNARRAPFTDLAARRRVDAAVDRREIVEGYLYGYGTPARTPVPPDVPGYVPVVSRTDSAALPSDSV